MMTDPTQQDAALRAFSIKRAAERLDTSPAALRYRVRRGFVHAARIGQRYLITAAELEHLLTTVEMDGERYRSEETRSAVRTA